MCIRRDIEHTVEGEHMAVVLVRADQELWVPGVPLASIIHVLEALIATQPMSGYRQYGGPYFSLNPHYSNITSTDV